MTDRLVNSIAALGLVLAPAVMKLADSSKAEASDDIEDDTVVECVSQPNAPIHRRYQGRSDIATHLAKGTPLQIISKRKNWRHVAYVAEGDAALGWVTDTYLEGCPGDDKGTEEVSDKSQPIRDSKLGVRIATFNIQNFGKTKLGKEDVVRKLTDTLHKYPLVAVQELSDSSNRVPRAFLDKINEGGLKYDVLVSSRSGAQSDDASSQEQYAFYFDTTVMKAESPGALFDDSQHDYFQREPFIARFRMKQGDLSFAIATVHTKPGDIEEIRHLDDVVAWSRDKFPGEENIVVLGDFNAGCDYASPEQLDELSIRNAEDYAWVVPDDADTNIAPKPCAYDRIVVTAGLASRLLGWGVDRTVTDKAVSDHWPVWAEFKVGE